MYTYIAEGVGGRVDETEVVVIAEGDEAACLVNVICHDAGAECLHCQSWYGGLEVMEIHAGSCNEQLLQ